MARRRKPHDPAAATRAAIERRERDEERKRMEAQGATVKIDRTGRIVSAYRSNVFNLLLQRGTITSNHHDASARLSSAWAAWKGLDGGPDKSGELVDGASGCREIITDRMIRAGREVDWALSSVDPLSRVILEAFMVATVEEDRPMAWRGIVERIGIKARDRQTEVVVASLEALRSVYQDAPARAA